MRATAIVYKAKSKAGGIKSLALSVYFKQPDLGMKDYEILSRASAFLLSVDPPELQKGAGPYGHLEANERNRKLKMHQMEHGYTPAGGPERELKDLGWLEFAPREARPTVHCVCSSHVLAPFLWKDYYPQNWLNKVKQEHCVYSLEVIDAENPGVALGKVALNPYPIHHPEGRDVALIHLKQEEENLKILKNLGVDVLYLRDLDDIYEKHDEVTFEGYVVAEPNRADSQDFDRKPGSSEEEDTRIFYPYKETGRLSFHARDRFFAETPEPLPEGLCGGPVLAKDGSVCGIVEGIVDKGHQNKEIAGSAAFMPNYMMTPFVEFAERLMLQRILPKSLFQRAVTAKTTNSLGGGIFKKDESGRYQPSAGTEYEEAFDRAVENLKSNHSPEEVQAILKTIERERKEVLDIMDKEGGDLEEVAARVRRRTMHIRETIHAEYRQRKTDDEVIEGEIVSDKS
mmetsp:Transcript_105421/g.157820  ORF Transcript_105421/g.157820 Transcript_105421/m.157820 type:complete len:456 (-) Transcript_105421:276-1643(-)